MYVDGIDMHVCTTFRHACTCIYKYIRFLTHINMYISCTYRYIHAVSVTFFLFTYMCDKVCSTDALCTDGYKHFMKCTDIAEQCTYSGTDILLVFIALLVGL
jgi:hypothetical protein